MGDEDVYERVTREHPELTGNDRLRAIRDLKRQQKADRRLARQTGRECPGCHETVKPAEPFVLGLFAALLALLAMATFAASIVAAVHPFTGATVHSAWRILLWPTAAVDGWTHPRPLAVLISFATLYASTWLLGKANDRANSRARCPKCSRPMPPPKP